MNNPTTLKPSHIDLFTGIGGFTLACQWAGIETEVFCEKDERCRRFLERTWPGIPIVPDVREFDGTKWTDRFILTAGVPCQPASRAGKQRGKEDDRWLWDDTLRVVSEARPDWCLFENPLGINDVGLDGILADLESLDYEVSPPLIIPACAVNSPQLRNRYWIVAHSASSRCKADGDKGTQQCNYELSNPQSHLADTDGGRYNRISGDNQEERRKTWSELPEEYRSIDSSSQSHLADTAEAGRRNTMEKRIYVNEKSDISSRNFWSNSVWLPCADGKVRRAPDDSFGVVDGLHRSLLGALGNSIVPQVAYEIIKAIVECRKDF